jgi:DtxR family Mn-dependent transcriptional regulator
VKHSRSVEDYLKAIYTVGNDDVASTTDVARHLNISAASVTGMLKKLDEMKLVKYERHRGVRLTHAGRLAALEIIRHHRLLELYLHEALGYPWDRVHEEAEKLEHHISEEFEDRIAAALGDPSYDPHGDPIPAKDGRLPRTWTERLSDAVIGETVIVRRVDSSNTRLLRSLFEHGVALGAALRVQERHPRTDAVTVRFKRTSITLDRVSASHIFIERP